MRLIPLVFLPFILIIACAEQDSPDRPNPNDTSSPNWLIDEHRVFDGGPGKDGIPSIDNPKFESIAQADSWLDDNELVVGLKIGNDVRAYPHDILDWHEIVNDSVGDQVVSITYCPLTGTALCWSRKLKLGVTTFGVSGLIYNSNLIPYDRETDSNWSQLVFKAVNGPIQGEEVNMFPLVEMNWGAWKKMYPSSKVLSRETGFDRQYGIYPYGDYLQLDQLIYFPIIPLNQTLPLKERMLGVVEGEKCKVYRMDKFQSGLTIYNDIFEEKEIVVAGDSKGNWGVSYGRKLKDGSVIELVPSSKSLPILMTDEEGNEWDIFGEAVSGPRAGEKLAFSPSFMGYWMGFSSFYPEPEIE